MDFCFVLLVDGVVFVGGAARPNGRAADDDDDVGGRRYK